MQSKIIIGVGNKARHGKDSFAEVVCREFEGDVFLTHWADPLKEEITNRERNVPLIYSTHSDSETYYMLLDRDGADNIYIIKNSSEVPYLHKIFMNRKIDVYWGMDEKDSEMLQFWGTDFRRMMYDPNYWVDKTMQAIRHRPEKYVIIPDTRFKNEWKEIKANNGIYVKVIRLNEDNTLFQDPSRDPKHPSEVDLDGVYGDYVIAEYSGKMESFEKKALEVIQKIKETN